MKKVRILERYAVYFSASQEPELVDVQTGIYLSLRGPGSPGTDEFYQKKKALNLAVHQLQEAFAGTDGCFEPGVLEIFYWFDESVTGFIDIGEFYTKANLDDLQYRMAIKIPEYIYATDIDAVLAKDTNANISFFKDMSRYEYTAGISVQVMHSGPFAGELQTLPKLQRFAESVGYRKNGMHHEIHLTDFNRGDDQTYLKTILRDPVKKIK